MKYIKRLIILFITLVIAGASYVPASADGLAEIENEDTSYDRYIAFGANLKPAEKATVLSIFGITETDLASYKTIEVTNQDEHDYLDDYLDAKVIGTRALSSVMIVKTEEGSGISVSTNNINYCTYKCRCT